MIKERKEDRINFYQNLLKFFLQLCLLSTFKNVDKQKKSSNKNRRNVNPDYWRQRVSRRQ